MAKKKGPSIHSRAARRATSPGIDTDKSLKDVKPPSRNTNAMRPSVLAIHQSAGVTKKAKRGRQLSAKARRRHEKNLEMAETVLERTSKKVEKSKGRGRTVQERRKTWEDINKIAEAEEGRAREEGREERGEGGEGDGAAGTDDEMEGADETTLTAAAPEPVASAASTAPVDADLDEIL